MNTKVTLTTLFAVSVAIANVTAAKLAWLELPLVGGVGIPAGFVAFGLAFLCSDLLVEFEGEEYARDVVNGTIAVLVVAYGLIQLSIHMPAAPFYEQTEAFSSVLGASGRVNAAAIVALSVSQHVDVQTFAELSKATDGRHKWLRNCGSTAFSQAIDTVLFITIAFGGTMAFPALVSTIAGQYVAKLGIVVADTLPFYAISGARERGWLGTTTNN